MQRLILHMEGIVTDTSVPASARVKAGDVMRDASAELHDLITEQLEVRQYLTAATGG